MKHRPLIISYILLIWFAISFITNLIGPLMPIAIQDFKLSLTMQSTPQACIDAYGEPDLDEEHERPGFSGRVLAWRLPTTNRAITFAGLGDDGTMLSYTACLIGCIGAWRSTQPEIFAP